MKAVWKGNISFGLVNIPIKLYSVAEPKQFSFRMLCNKCQTPLKYKRWCPKCKVEVAWQDVLFGFQIEKGKWKAFTRQELNKLKPEKAEEIEIICFTSLEAFDPLLFSKHYFVVPEHSNKAYFLLQQVLQAKAKVAFGKMILHEKEHLVVIRAYKNGLLLTTLYYPYELRDIAQLEELKAKVSISKQEFELAAKLIEKMTSEPDLNAYEDTFEKRLKEVLLGKKEVKPKKPKPEKLLEALELSVKAVKSSKSKEIE
jgi:DNA end-binding protein Ku